MSRLSPSQISLQISTLSHWKLQNEKLHAELTFKDFTEAFDFMTQVAKIADEMNHHPEWSNVYNRVTIDLTTHDSGGISEKDFKLAAQIDQILK